MSGLLIYTEGGTFGLGHVVRCLQLANALTERGVKVEFAMPEHEHIGWSRIARTPYRLHDLMPECSLLPGCVGSHDALLIDVESYPGTEFMRQVRPYYPNIVLIGGVSYPPAGEIAEYVDFQIYQGELFDFPATPTALNGPEYLIIDRLYTECRPDPCGPVVVCMGGRDPFNLTPIAIDALIGIGCRVIAIRGPAVEWEPEDNHSNSDLEIVDSPDSLVPHFDRASLAVVATGMTCYEALAAGLPCLLTNISPDHERTAVELERRGCAWNMGQWHGFDEVALRVRVLHLLAHPDELARMGAAGRALVDGRGAERCARAILEAL